MVVDPNNGDILAMGSVPSFDPNVFIPSVSADDWKKLNTDAAIPLVSRAVSGFPPGSTFKIVTALGGLSEQRRMSMENSHFNCPGGISYGDHYFKCWIAEKHGTHGTLGLADALRVSCDCFFYQYGNAAGIEYDRSHRQDPRHRRALRSRPGRMKRTASCPGRSG